MPAPVLAPYVATPLVDSNAPPTDHEGVDVQRGEQSVAERQAGATTDDQQAGDEHAAEHEDKDEDEGFLSFLRERRFTFQGMSKPQRLITGLAIGQLLASALLILLNLIPQPLVHTELPGGGLNMPLGALIAVDVFNICGGANNQTAWL